MRPVVVGLPRGGVPVAERDRDGARAPLEILAVRKLGAPHNPEYGIGAIAEDGTRVFDPEALAVLGIDGGTLEAIVARESEELRRRVAAYRGDRPPMPLRGPHRDRRRRRGRDRRHRHCRAARDPPPATAPADPRRAGLRRPTRSRACARRPTRWSA